MPISAGLLAGTTAASVATVASTALHSVTLTDTSGGGSAGFYRFGLAFEKGDVPSGRILVAKIGSTTLRSAMLQRNTWSDGSLRSCILALDAGTVGAGASVTVDITSAVGAQGTAALNPWVYLAAQQDLTVEITNRTGSASGALPSLTFSLQAALANSQRRQVQDSTPVCVRAFVWETTGSEKHLACLHYLDLWLSAAGNVMGVEWTPVMSLHWWTNNPFADGVQTKERNIYDAAAKDGATVLDSRSALSHTYGCQWASLYASNDDQHARRHWLNKGAAMPRLRHAYSAASLQRMMRAGYLPPLDLTKAYAPTHSNTYVPLGTNNHRAAINGTGGYEGRGMVTNPDAIALVQQTAAAWRIARVSAQASLAVFHHYKDHRAPASGGVFEATGGPSLGLFPQRINRNADGTTGAAARTYAGLATEGFVFTTGTTAITFTAANPTSGSTKDGAFSNWDDAHHTVYGYCMAFVDGERYLADAVQDQFNYLLAAAPGSKTALYPNNNLAWASSTAGSRGQLQSVPIEGNADNKWGMNLVDFEGAQERSIAWRMLNFGHLFALLPDGDRHRPYLANLAVNASNYLTQSASFFPAAQATYGTYWVRNPPFANLWMCMVSSLMMMRSQVLLEKLHPGYDTFIDLQLKAIVRSAKNCPYHLAFDVQTINQTKVGNTYLPTGESWINHDVTIDATANTITYDDSTQRPHPANGDKIRFSSALDALPGGVTEDTDFFLVNKSGVDPATYQVAATSGGAAIDLTTSAAGVDVAIKIAALPGLTVIGTGGGQVEDDDSFAKIHEAGLKYGLWYGSSEVDQAAVDAMVAFNAPIAAGNFASWFFDVGQLA